MSPLAADVTSDWCMACQTRTPFRCEGTKPDCADMKAHRQRSRVADAMFAKITADLDEQAREIARQCGANELETDTILQVSRLVRHGHEFCDLHIRKDGHEYRFEADWVCRLFRLSASEAPTEVTGAAGTQKPGAA